MATILYARVSTAEQTLAHQRKQAEAAGFRFDTVVSDDGVSGYSVVLVDRPEGRRLFDILRRGDTLVVRWLNRLGRNYDDITANMRTFMAMGVIVRTVIGNMEFDGATSDPVKKAIRDATIAFLASSAQAEHEAMKDAQRAGIDHARETDSDSYRGRKPEFTRSQFETVRDMLGKGETAAAVVKATGLSRQSVYRLRDDPVRAERILATWERAA